MSSVPGSPPWQSQQAICDKWRSSSPVETALPRLIRTFSHASNGGKEPPQPPPPASSSTSRGGVSCFRSSLSVWQRTQPLLSDSLVISPAMSSLGGTRVSEVSSPLCGEQAEHRSRARKILAKRHPTEQVKRLSDHISTSQLIARSTIQSKTITIEYMGRMCLSISWQ